MVQEELLKMLGAALVSAGGEVPLDHVESLLREKFDVELPHASNHVTLEKYLVTNFSDICRVKRATDGHFVLRMLQLPSISHLLPVGYDEPEFEPLTTTEFRKAPSAQPNGIPCSLSNGAARPQDGVIKPPPNGAAAPPPNRSPIRQLNGALIDRPKGVPVPQPNGTLIPQPRVGATPQASTVPGPPATTIPRPPATTIPRPPVTMIPRPPATTISRPPATAVPSNSESRVQIPPPNGVPIAPPEVISSPHPDREPNRVTKANLVNHQNHSDRIGVRSAAVIKAPTVAPQQKFDTLFTKNDYQDDQNAATILANLENQLSEECSVRGIIEPTFKLTTYGKELKEVFCVGSWGSEKIQSHPGVFATEEGAKASVIKKMLIGIDELAPKLLSYESSVVAESPDDSSARQSPDRNCTSTYEKTADAADSPEIVQEEELVRSNRHGGFSDPEPGGASPDSEYGGVLQEDSLKNDEHPTAQTDVSDSVRVEPQQSTHSAPDAPWRPLSAPLDALIINQSPVDLEPRIDMEQPVSQGYLTHVSADGSFMVQVKGPGLAKWERQTFAFDPRSPTKKIIPFRWYVAHIVEGTDVDFYDRVMCMSEEGPFSDELGYVQLHFPDNGYEDLVDPNMVFDLENYDEINRVPIQGVRIHAVGLTGATPVEELRVTHPPHNQLLFLPADRSNCFMTDCSVDVPHVYIYNMDIKRVLC